MEGMSEEKCALVAELVRVLEMVRQLEAHTAAAPPCWPAVCA